MTHGLDFNSFSRLGLMVWTRTHCIDLDSWYSIGTLELDMYKRAECCPYAGFFMLQHRRVVKLQPVLLRCGHVYIIAFIRWLQRFKYLGSAEMLKEKTRLQWQISD